MTIGLYEFVVMIAGIIIYAISGKTRANIRDILSHCNEDNKIVFVNIFTIVLLVHASIFCFFFMLYLLFIGAIYYYFKMYDGFKTDTVVDEI